MWRALRLVVDTGLHWKGWSRKEAIDYMVANTDRPEASAATEVDRYIVMPGQATAYKIGQMTISRLRAEAERHPKFDIRRFHDVVLGAGRIPLAVLERRVREQLF